jgi:protocatechuate 3,4-dioxygenase beta subunit
MDNDDATVGTILSRREALTLAARTSLGLAFGGLVLADADAAFQAKAQREVQLVASPAVTEGPFFVDEKLNRSNLLADTTRTAVVHGAPLTVTFTVYRLTNGKFAPLKGAMVDVWHCDALGVYSDEPAGMNAENTTSQKWLRGYQVTDENGVVKFTTIVPGWYRGRTTHIHFKVRQTDGKTAKEFTSQIFFDDSVADGIFANAPYKLRGAREARNATDMVFTERQVDGSQAGEHLFVDLKKTGSGKGYEAKFAVALTDNNLRVGGGHRPRGGPPPDWE